MWTTRWADGTAPYTVTLFRNGVVFAAIPLDEWWVMSATRYLADSALRENHLDFKASDIYGPDRNDVPIWTTNLVPTGDGYEVHLMRDGVAVTVISLEDWAKLSATEYAVEDAIEVAGGLCEYGNNIEEVKQALEQLDEEGFLREEYLDRSGAHQRQRRDEQT